jgi:hypothetical protein
MADDAKQAWNEVAERFSAWGRHVADRYKEMGSVAGETAQESQRKLEEAARDLSEQLNRAFGALGETLRDEQAKTELKDAVRAVGDAVAITVTETGEAIRRRVTSSHTGDDASDTAA